jgi:hypothetical protein
MADGWLCRDGICRGNLGDAGRKWQLTIVVYISHINNKLKLLLVEVLIIYIYSD